MPIPVFPTRQAATLSNSIANKQWTGAAATPKETAHPKQKPTENAGRKKRILLKLKIKSKHENKNRFLFEKRPGHKNAPTPPSGEIFYFFWGGFSSRLVNWRGGTFFVETLPSKFLFHGNYCVMAMWRGNFSIIFALLVFRFSLLYFSYFNGERAAFGCSPFLFCGLSGSYYFCSGVVEQMVSSCGS